jgi:hypothetical protein
MRTLMMSLKALVPGRSAGFVLVGALATVLFSGGVALAAGPPEAPVTGQVTNITSTSAVFNGVLNPKSFATVDYFFFYGAAGRCNAERTEVGEATGEAIEVTAAVTTLEPSTKYMVCLVAMHGEGFERTLGSTVSFETKPSKPTVDTEGSSAAPFAAGVEAQVNPQNQPTTSCVFEYGTTTAYGTSVPCEPASIEGYGDRRVSASLAGLTTVTTYHYRVVVKNATGTTDGSDAELTTLAPEKPIIDSEGTSGVSLTAATLEAQIDPRSQETTCRFQYGTDSTLLSSTTVGCAQAGLGTGFDDQLGSARLEGLKSGETYYYRVVAENATGASEGAIQSFTTLDRPIVSADAQSPTRNTVVLSGTVDPGGVPTTYHFVYIDQAGYEAAIADGAEDPYAEGASTAFVGIGGDFEVHPVTVVAGELMPNTTYHYALVALNSQGMTTSPDMTFTTQTPTPPIVTTGVAADVSQDSATLSATIDTRGLQTIYGFEIGSEPGVYGEPTGLGAVGSGASEATVTLNLTALQPGATYHYRIVATSADGTTYGADRSFTTGTFANVFVAPPAPLPFLAVPPIKFPAPSNGVAPKSSTNVHTLKKALEACKHKPKSKRAACERNARKRFHAKPKSK